MLAPTILDSPAPLLARQWRKGFDIAKLVTGPLSLACGVAFGALAYRGKFETYLSSSVDLNCEFAHHVLPLYEEKTIFSLCSIHSPRIYASAMITVLLNFHHRRTWQLDIQVPYDGSYSDPIDYPILDCRHAASEQEAERES